MNTAFLDAQNLAWKIHAVEGGFAHRSILETYEAERRDVAETLLNFDNKYAKLFSQRPPEASTVQAAAASSTSSSSNGHEDNDFIRTFKESCEFTSGYGVAYKPNALNWSPEHPAQSHLTQPTGTKLRTGRLLTNADVTRVVDANVVHLEQEVPLNGAFRLFVFAGKPRADGSGGPTPALRDLAVNMARRGSFYSAYRRADADAVSHHERHTPHSRFFTVCVVFAAPRAQVDIDRDLPPLLARYRQHVYADDRWDRRVPDATAAAHAKMGLDQERGGVVVVRPDGYVGMVVGLEEGGGTVDALNAYFGAFASQKLGSELGRL